MTQDLEPKPGHGREIDLLVSFLAATAEPHGAVYLSAPITTGKRFSEWHAQSAGLLEASHPEYRNGHTEHVVKPNRAHARALVRRLRANRGRVLVDPTAVPDFEGWTQDDYRVLWARIVERYANSVVFVDGWEYSNGCAYEFLTAQRLQLPVFSESGSPLALESGIRLLSRAIAELKERRVDVAFLAWVAARLRGNGSVAGNTLSQSGQ